jgi:hypothetical protein
MGRLVRGFVRSPDMEPVGGWKPGFIRRAAAGLVRGGQAGPAPRGKAVQRGNLLSTHGPRGHLHL